MQAHQFQWVWLLLFQRYCYFKNGQIFLLDYGLTKSMVIKKFNLLASTQKIHASRGGCVMHAHYFLWVWPLWFRRYCYFQKQRYCYFQIFGQISLSDHGLHGGQKFIDQNQFKNSIQVEVDVTYMHTNFCWCSYSNFEDNYCYFQFWSNLPFKPWTTVHGGRKIQSNRIGSKIHTSGGLCNIHARQFCWHSHSSFGDIATSNLAKISLSDHGLM